MKTVLEIIRLTTAYFQQNRVESARLNIEMLLAHVLRKKRMDLYLEFDRILDEEELTPLRVLVKRRAHGEPLQHLLGNVEFCGHSFHCDPRALIPRPETEQLCELIFRNLQSGSVVPKRILDVGTGSGVIACTLAKGLPESEIVAGDVSPEALTLARENAVQLGLEERIQFVCSDLSAAIDGEFDLVVANLPYIPRGDIPNLAIEVQREPHLALDGGIDGAELFRRFVPEVCSLLRGCLALEIGQDQGPVLRGLLEEHNYKDIQVLSDYEGRDRFVFANYG